MLPAARPAVNVLSHWYSLYERGQFSSAEFYDSVEAELAERKLPRLRSSRPEFHEGGALSDKRVYLRLERERYAFDVCAAPFGTGYFFSYRMIEKPRSRLAFVLLLVACLVAVVFALRTGLGLYELSIGAVGLLLLTMVASPRNVLPVRQGEAKVVTVETEENDFDSAILNIAVVGELYERFRADTYYRYDTRLLFQTIVPDIVKRKVDDLTSRDGVTLLNAYEYSPLLGETYRAVKLEKLT